MDNKIIFPIIILFLGFGYLIITLWLHKKRTMFYGFGPIPFFAEITEKSDKKNYWAIFIMQLIVSFFIIVFCLEWLITGNIL